jgi:hypothetical protein
MIMYEALAVAFQQLGMSLLTPARVSAQRVLLPVYWLEQRVFNGSHYASFEASRRARKLGTMFGRKSIDSL